MATAWPAETATGEKGRAFTAQSGRLVAAVGTVFNAIAAPFLEEKEFFHTVICEL